MKARVGVILLVFGYCLDFLAGLIGMMHWPGSPIFVIIATFLKISGCLILLFKLLSYPKAKEFLNW